MKSLLEIPAGTLLIALGEMLHTEYANIEITKRTPHFVSGWVRKDRIEPWRPFHITATEYFAANPEAPAVTEGVAPREELFSTSAEDRNRIATRRARIVKWLKIAGLALLAIGILWTCSGCSTMTPDLAHKSGLVHCIGNSMGATMPGEQTLQLDRCAYADLKAGDIVVYFNAWTACLVCHRITRPGSLGGWITKGDANSREDRGIVTRENFYGRIPMAHTRTSN